MIKSNPAEVERRKQQAKTTITAWSQSDDGRKTASETAIRTSSRPEILVARTEQLKVWRDAHPLEFVTIIEKMQNSFCSKPQRKLFEECQKIDEGFRHNRQILNPQFSNKTNRRQVDVLHPEKLIVIEFDGPYHFFGLKNSSIEDVRKRDAELNDVLVSVGYTVVRLTYEDYNHRQGGSFSERARRIITDAVCGNINGVHKIGEAYAQSR